jgi:hypothetical protein
MKSVILVILIIVFVVVDVGASIPPEDIDHLPTNEYENGQRRVFDFIVIGAGASGCIVAARYFFILLYIILT